MRKNTPRVISPQTHRCANSHPAPLLASAPCFFLPVQRSSGTERPQESCGLLGITPGSLWGGQGTGVAPLKSSSQASRCMGSPGAWYHTSGSFYSVGKMTPQAASMTSGDQVSPKVKAGPLALSHSGPHILSSFCKPPPSTL